MDARILAGIGDIYACETFCGAASPRHPRGQPEPGGLDPVLTETRRIQHAIRKGGTTVANYLNSRGEAGLFQLELLVYGRTANPAAAAPASNAWSRPRRSSFFCRFARRERRHA